MRRKRLEKLLAQGIGNGLGAVHYQLDAGQVEVRQALAFEQLQEMLVTEVRRTQLRRLEFGRLDHPQQRPPNEHVRVHDRVVHSGGQHAQVKADQSHVVRERHPAQSLIVGIPVGALDDSADVDAEVTVGKADPFGIARGAGRVLNERDIFGCRRINAAVFP